MHGEADKTCDCCGRIVTGIEHGDGIHTHTVWFGGLAYQAGACKNCYQDSALDQFSGAEPPDPTFSDPCQLCTQPMETPDAVARGVCDPCQRTLQPQPRDKRRRA